MHAETGRSKSGFTLVELLVVIAIVASLMTVAFVVGMKQLDKGKKVQTISQFRDLAAGMEGFIAEHQRPPMKIDSSTQLPTDTDSVYGEERGENPNSLIVAALRGETPQFPYQGETSDAKIINPTSQQYMDFPYAPDKKKGVADDGRLYDPWGKQIMMAVNAPPYIEESAGGRRDKLLYTAGKAVYTDTQPYQQQYVFWSFGKDGKKGNNGPTITARVAYAGSDDVISW
jgi:prepilin-type N-terminal cleavage/methylation domain-containing protein